MGTESQSPFDGEMAELFESFLVETNEILETLGQNLVELEKRSADAELHNTIFRAVHTVKGTSSFLGFDQLTKLAHHFEDLLNKIRRGELAVTSAIIDVILESFDMMKLLLRNIETRDLTPVNLTAILETLDETAQSALRVESATAAAPSATPSAMPSATPDPMARVEQSSSRQEETARSEQVVSEDALSESRRVGSSTSLRPPQPSAFDGDMKELLESFLVETNEILESLGQDLVKLENEPTNAELHNTIFRAVHTVKGTSSFLGFEQLTRLAHAFEDLLNRIRRNELTVSSLIGDVLLEGFDSLKDLVRRIEARDMSLVDLSEVLGKLKVALKGNAPGGDVASNALPDSRRGESKGVKPAEKKEPAGQGKGISEQTIRVDVNRLDSLMNLVGELVLARNQLAQVAGNMAEEHENLKITRSLADANSQIDFITTELQMAVMKTRMVPVGKLFGKLPRLLRDLTRETGKEIELLLFGEETDLDKSIIEELNDPLVHIIRNSADHGIEAPNDREKAGKSSKGTVIVKAEHEGNSIVISIQDDGKGMDPAILKRKGVEKGLITEAQAREMSKKEAFNLIFAPGFSTAAKVTNVSGRGVGMDVVRTNIAKLKGIIEIESEVGKGTKLILKLPLTLAIIQGLLARVQTDVFAIPLESVLEVIRVQRKDIATINGREVIRLRDSVIPLARISEVFDIAQTTQGETWMYVVVVGVAERRLGMIVDSLLGQKEIVVKSLGEYLGDVPGVAGSTILGDGRAIIIVDVAQFMDLCAERIGITTR